MDGKHIMHLKCLDYQQYLDDECTRDLKEVVDVALKLNVTMSTALDLGANAGFWTLRLASLGVKVVAIEGSPWTFKMLLENIDTNKIKDYVYPINATVAPNHGLAEFRGINHNDGLNYGENWPIQGYSAKVTLPELIDKFHPDFIKCDIEGDEHKIFPLLEPEDLSTVKVIYIEEHDLTDSNFYTPNFKSCDLLNEMRRLGFKRKGNSTYVREDLCF